MDKLPTIAIVVPCYNEEKALPQSLPALNDILDRQKAEGTIADDSFILCVDDGSTDKTWEVIKQMHAKSSEIHGITLAHNRGHQFALYAGLMHVRNRCDAAISIDADLQDDPEAIGEMISLYRSGYEIVYGVRQSRKTDSWFKRTSARSFYRLQKAMGLEIINDHADFRLMSRSALDILSQYREQNLFLRGIVPQIGLSTAIVHYDRNERIAGKSKYPLKKMLAFSVDGITSFTARPIRWILTIGLIMLLLDIIVSIYVLVSYFAGKTVGGWTSIMLSVWFLGSLILIGLGIVGEYIGKIFIEVKDRPRYNIRDEI